MAQEEGQGQQRQRGRFVTMLPGVTLAGVPVRLHRIGAATLRDLHEQVRAEWRASDDQTKHEPKPPVVTAGEITEANYADPDYQKDHAAWKERLSAAQAMRIVDFMALEVVQVEVDMEAVAHYRASRRRFGLGVRWDDEPFFADFEQADRDRLVYVSGVLLDSASATEVRAFNAWVYRGELPSEQEVSDAMATFRVTVARSDAAGGDPPPAAERPDDAPARGADRRV